MSLSAQTRRKLLKAGYVFIFVGSLALAWIYSHKGDGRSTREHKQIAEGCLRILQLRGEKETEFKPDDPRLPDAILGLQPKTILIAGDEVIIVRRDKPIQYVLSRDPMNSKVWNLYAGGPGFWGHEKMTSIESTVIPYREPEPPRWVK
jgi:hypothetical protein